MPKKKLPWRTLAPPGPHGRIDPEIVTQTLLELKAKRDAEKERERAERRARRPKKD